MAPKLKIVKNSKKKSPIVTKAVLKTPSKIP